MAVRQATLLSSDADRHGGRQHDAGDEGGPACVPACTRRSRPARSSGWRCPAAGWCGGAKAAIPPRSSSVWRDAAKGGGELGPAGSADHAHGRRHRDRQGRGTAHPPPRGEGGEARAVLRPRRAHRDRGYPGARVMAEVCGCGVISVDRPPAATRASPPVWTAASACWASSPGTRSRPTCWSSARGTCGK